MKVLKQINKFTFQEVEVPDHVVDEVYSTWLNSNSTEKFDLLKLIEEKGE